MKWLLRAYHHRYNVARQSVITRFKTAVLETSKKRGQQTLKKRKASPAGYASIMGEGGAICKNFGTRALDFCNFFEMINLASLLLCSLCGAIDCCTGKHFYRRRRCIRTLVKSLQTTLGLGAPRVKSQHTNIALSVCIIRSVKMWLEHVYCRLNVRVIQPRISIRV